MNLKELEAKFEEFAQNDVFISSCVDYVRNMGVDIPENTKGCKFWNESVLFRIAYYHQYGMKVVCIRKNYLNSVRNVSMTTKEYLEHKDKSIDEHCPIRTRKYAEILGTIPIRVLLDEDEEGDKFQINGYAVLYDNQELFDVYLFWDVKNYDDD